MAESASDQFDRLIGELAADDEVVVHSLAERLVGEFSDQVDAMLAGLSDRQVHLLWCSVEAVMAKAGVQVDSPRALRLMFLMVNYGWWLKSNEQALHGVAGEL